MAALPLDLILDGLTRAVADPGGLAPVGKGATAMFPATALGRECARRCLEEGWIAVRRIQANGNSARERAQPTPKGVALLAQSRDPLRILTRLADGLTGRSCAIESLIRAAEEMRSDLKLTCLAVEGAAQRLHEPQALGPVSHEESDVVKGYLANRPGASAGADCPLPELYRYTQSRLPGVSIGRFHDTLRRLHESGALVLHPWTGPLYEIPEPAVALLVGHEVCYYSSPIL